MKTRYQYIHFIEAAPNLKTSVWECISNSRGNVLGVVKWHGAWRQYCFFPEPKTLYNWACLGDIERFLKQLMLDYTIQNSPTSGGEDAKIKTKRRRS